MNNCKHEHAVGCQWISTWVGDNLGPNDVSGYYRGVRCLDCGTMLVQSVMPHTTYMLGWEKGDINPIAPVAELTTWWEFQKGLEIPGYKYNITENVQ